MSHQHLIIQVCYLELYHVSLPLFYSAELYTEETLQVKLEPLAKWCNAEYIEKSVSNIIANENRVTLADGSSVEYDVLALNLGSRT